MPQPRFVAPPPLSLYVHLPWCARKCPYCDFNSHALRGELEEARYVDALLADLDADLPRVQERPVRSVFIGGGTPSLFSEQAVARLLEGVRARLRVHASAEITLEANPGAVDSQRLRGFVRAGVTRLSVGVQSFEDSMLRGIGRIHDAGAARDAVEAALASGASRVNVDLMFGLPGQSVAQAAADVDVALRMGVEHLSWYQLTVEPNTAFHRQPPPLPDDEVSVAMHEAGMEMLANAGLERYEVSAFARPSARCRHNLNYWRFGDYLGIGAGAHGKITMVGDRAVVRTAKLRHPARFQSAAAAGDALAHARRVATGELPFEFMLNALRLTRGFDESLFPAVTGLPLRLIASELSRCVSLGLLERRAARIVPTALGRRFLNDLVAHFLPA